MYIYLRNLILLLILLQDLHATLSLFTRIGKGGIPLISKKLLHSNFRIFSNRLLTSNFPIPSNILPKFRPPNISTGLSSRKFSYGNIDVRELTPRDGLQFMRQSFSVPHRLNLIEGLVGAGASFIEAGSFVNPLAVPNMHGASEIVKTLKAKCAQNFAPNVKFSFLTPNYKAMCLAIHAGIDQNFGEISVVIPIIINNYHILISFCILSLEVVSYDNRLERQFFYFI